MPATIAHVCRQQPAWSRRYDEAWDEALRLRDAGSAEAEELLAERPRRRVRRQCEVWSLAVEGLALRLREGAA